MALLPTSLGTRPRLAVEVRPEGVIAARADENSPVIAAISHAEFPAGTAVPLLRPGASATHTPGETAPTPALNPLARNALVAAVRKSLDSVCQRGRDATLIVPDSSVRVLLLDFDELPSKAAEALPVVRFRLKKLLPFEADDAAVSYQVMSSVRGLVRVLAVAMPREILTTYESIVREAGFEPGAILPSTLAALAGLPEGDTPRLLVNIGRDSVTTAIVRAGLLLLHRSIDLRNDDSSVTDAPSAPASGYLDPIEASVRVQAAELLRETAHQDALLTTTELAQAVSVATAYFEDTLNREPEVLLSSGTFSSGELESMLAQAGIAGVPVREVVDTAMLAPGVAGRVNTSLLAGLRGGAGKLMRIAINLATRPFVELRPLYNRLRIAMGALALLAIALGVGIHSLSQRARAAQDRMSALRSQTLAFQAERQNDERRMQQPGNRAVLDRSRFLNALFQRKSFSWTAVMMDLERVLPPGVQVTSIEPVVSPEGDVTIRLRVSGNRDRAIELVRNLERSQRFLQPRLSNESAQSQEGSRNVALTQPIVPGGVEFEIISGYNPLPETAPVKMVPVGVPASSDSHSTHRAKSTQPLRARPIPHPAGGAR